MRQIIFILLTITIFIPNLRAEDSLVFKLISLEKVYFTSKSNHEKTLIAFQKLKLLLLNNYLDEKCITEIDRIEEDYLPNFEKENFLWNASLINYINKNNSKAVYWFERYQEYTLDSSIESLLFSSLVYSELNNKKSIISLNQLAKTDTSFNCLFCLNDEEYSNNKNKRIKIISSAIFPGLGMILNGNIIKGLTSTLLNTSSILFVIYSLKNKSYINAPGWGISFLQKFYTGNLKLTEKLIEEKQNIKYINKSNQCRKSWVKILENYPLKIKQ
jgi:hypothetical protein